MVEVFIWKGGLLKAGEPRARAGQPASAARQRLQLINQLPTLTGVPLAPFNSFKKQVLQKQNYECFLPFSGDGHDETNASFPTKLTGLVPSPGALAPRVRRVTLSSFFTLLSASLRPYFFFSRGIFFLPTAVLFFTSTTSSRSFPSLSLSQTHTLSLVRAARDQLVFFRAPLGQRRSGSRC